MDRTLAPDAVSAALAAAAEVVGMETVYVGRLDPTRFLLQRLRASQGWPRAEDGAEFPLTRSLCHYLLATGGPTYSGEVGADPRCAAFVNDIGVRSYVGVPVRDADGALIATLCAIDRTEVPVSPAQVAVLVRLADVVAALLAEHPRTDAVVVRRTAAGWAVSADTGASTGELTDDLADALVLADLLGELPEPGARVPAESPEADEVTRLRRAVAQLEHALAHRVAVERALGVLAERRGTTPRQAFELLRRESRRTGRKVHELARDVLATLEQGAA